MAKIMLVEDDNNLREIYEARLAAEGYELVSARDGEEALAMASKEQPDLVISDVMMPKISGFEMLDILRNTDGLKQLKVIMLTALGQAEDKIRADSLGADRYLVKSQVTLEDIVKATHDLLDTPAAQSVPAQATPRGLSLPPDSGAAAPAGTPVPYPGTTDTGSAAAAVPTSPAPVSVPDPQGDAALAVPTIAVAPLPATPATGTASAAQEPPASASATPPPATPDPTDAAPLSASDNDTQQSIAAEEAAIKAQIENFVNKQPADTGGISASDPLSPAQPPAAPAETSPPVTESAPDSPQTVAPEVPPTEQPPAAPETSPDVIPPTVQPEPIAPTTLTNYPDEPVEPAVAPQSTAAGSSDSQAAADIVPDPATAKADMSHISIAGKKTLQPLASNAQPDIHQLLASEEARAAAQAAAYSLSPMPPAAVVGQAGSPPVVTPGGLPTPTPAGQDVPPAAVNPPVVYPGDIAL